MRKMNGAARAEAAAVAGPRRPAWLAAGMTALALGAAWAGQARSEEHTTVSHGISTFGDLTYPADFAHLDYVNPNAPKGGEFSFSWTGSFDSMNPYTVKGRPSVLSSVFYESLLAGTADAIGEAYCYICETLEYPEDRGWVIFNLRDDVTFSDGSPLTTADVLFSFELFRDKGLNSFRVQMRRQVETVEAIDPHTIKFTFEKGIPTRDLPMDVGGLPIFSKAHYEANGRDLEESSLEPFLGSAAYVLGEIDVGQTVVYRRNPDHWGVNHPLNVGQNNYDSIRLEYFADGNASFEAFKAGAYTFRNEATSKNWATAYDFPAINKGWVVKREYPHGRKAPNQVFVLNLRRDKFQDPRVREAIGLMFNFVWSNDTLFYGIYDRTSSFWGNSTLQADGLPSEEELALLEPLADILPAGVLDAEPYEWPNGSPRQVDRRLLRRAGELLDEAGWSVGSDGMRRKAGQLLTVEVLNDSQSFDRVLNPFVENLRRLGVDATHNRIDNAQLESRERPPSYDFDIVVGHLSTNYIPGTELRQYFGSETADESVFNKGGLKSEAVDAVIEHVVAAENQRELETAISALDRVLRAEKFVVPQWFKAADTVAYYDFYRHPENLPPFSLGQLGFWWIDQEAFQRLDDDGAF